MGPPIPHIQDNYVSLEHVVGNVLLQCYQDFTTVLRTLPSIAADVARKRELLGYIVNTRQQLVKLYVLCKWAVVAPDISKCIDVSNWLHGQTNCFNNVVAALFHLQQGISAAKLQYADIESALQILKYGGPIQNTYNFLVPKKLEPADILETLRDLNVLLAIRLALVEKLSPIYRNYSISDGRAKFLVPNSVKIEIGIADDSVDARFFFVDFAFDFDFQVAPHIKPQLETIFNEKLSTQGLRATLDWALHYTSNCKLALINKQLAQMQQNYWAKVLAHTFIPSKSLVRIQYWLPRPGTCQVLIGINHSHLIQVQWLAPEETQLPNEFLVEFAASLNVDALLTSITKHHAKLLLEPLVKLRWVEKTSDLQLALSFSRIRSCLLSVDHSSGKLALPAGDLMEKALEQLNGIPDLTKGPAILEQLRLLVHQETVMQRAQAVGWQGFPSMRMEPSEMAKFAGGAGEAGTASPPILGIRLPAWAEGWFVVIAFGPADPCWYATQMLCKQRRWSIGTLHQLSVKTADPDYGVFKRLGESCTKQFTMYELCRELDIANVTYHQGRSKMQIYLDLRTINKDYTEWAFSGVAVTVNDVEVRLEIHIREAQLDRLGEIQEEGISLEKNILLIKLERSTQVLPKATAKLDEIDRIAKWLRLATNSSLKIRRASLKELELNYTQSPLALLTIRGNDLCLANENPQKFLTPFLPPLLARGGPFSVINVLTVSYPVFEAVQNLNCIVIPHGIGALRIQVSTDQLAPQLYVQLRPWRDDYMIYLTANKEALALEALKNIFTVPAFTGCVPLRDGVAAPIDKSEQLLTHAVGLIKA